MSWTLRAFESLHAQHSFAIALQSRLSCLDINLLYIKAKDMTILYDSEMELHDKNNTLLSHIFSLIPRMSAQC